MIFFLLEKTQYHVHKIVAVMNLEKYVKYIL